MMRGRVLFSLLLILFSGISNAADVLLLYSDYCSNSTLTQFNVACSFYGLESRKVLIEDSFYDEDSLRGIIKAEKVKAIVITADLLELYEIQNTFLQKSDSDNVNVPVLIADVTSEIDPSLLSVWSDNSIIDCASSRSPYEGYFTVSKNKPITAQLGGFLLPARINQVFQLQLNGRGGAEPLIKIYRSSRLLTIFSRMNIYNREVFFLARIDGVPVPENTNWRYRHSNFFQFAPWMFFLHYACNVSCFHVSDRFANFTIDDAWLTDPYGYFSYGGLLAEMKKNNFHTTVAFIPWNYDRSKKDVVELIAANPDKYSICIHGNNHDEKEFNEGALDFGEFISSNNEKEYEAGIKQAMARMERFKELTSIPYEKVMIFPHGFPPVKTLGILKKYNFISTVNANNVPPDSVQALEPVRRLRAVNNIYENIPSYERYPADEISPLDISIDLFLGNPILIHAHHDFFKNGIDRFNIIARKINLLQPGIRWMSLGEISRRYYLERKNTDGFIEVYPFSNDVLISNKSKQSLQFSLTRSEDDLRSIKRISIDDQQCDYSVSRDSIANMNNIIIQAFITPGQNSHIAIEYRNNFRLNEIDISKNAWDINIIRHIADFRDMNVSTNYFGRMITGIYYSTGLNELGIKRGFIVALMILSLFIIGIKYLFRFIRKESRQPEHQKA